MHAFRKSPPILYMKKIRSSFMQKYKISSVDFDHNITFKGLYFWVGLTHTAYQHQIFMHLKSTCEAPL